MVEPEPTFTVENYDNNNKNTINSVVVNKTIGENLHLKIGDFININIEDERNYFGKISKFIKTQYNEYSIEILLYNEKGPSNIVTTFLSDNFNDITLASLPQEGGKKRRRKNKHTKRKSTRRRRSKKTRSSTRRSSRY